MIKALFFDIDGTLVSFKTHRISAQTIASIEKAKANGVHIFIATGRPNAIIDNLDELQSRNLIDGYVTMNGAYCFVGDEVIYKSPLPQQDVRNIIEYCREKAIPTVVVGENKIGVCQCNQHVQDIFHNFLKVDTHIPEISEEEAYSWGEIYQLTPFITKEQELEIELPNSEISRWHPEFTDVTAIGNNKQKGIDQIIEHFGIKLSETMAIGDGGNDISMLKHAAVGVAMGNALPDVKDAADHITHEVDEEGITHALKHFGVI